MTERFERMITFGPPPVTFGRPETYTDKVKALYRRLKDGDYKALAPLIANDIEFLREPTAIAALVILKYDRQQPDKKANAELRKIANVIRRRPRSRGARLPYGDWLQAECNWLESLIYQNQMLKIKEKPHLLRERILDALTPKPRPAPLGWIEWNGVREEVPPEEPISIPNDQKQRICEALLAGVRTGTGHVRTAKSWAKQAIAHLHGVSAKETQKRISRDLKSGRRRRGPDVRDEVVLP